MISSDFQVFVYGTLKPGGHYWPRYCEGRVNDVTPAKIHGKLYDLHVGYPGIVLGGDDWVHGYLLTFPHEADFLQLDVLEGYQPERDPSLNEYNRLQVVCYSDKGVRLGDVWVYEMTHTTMQRKAVTRIESGNWAV